MEKRKISPEAAEVWKAIGGSFSHYIGGLSGVAESCLNIVRENITQATILSNYQAGFAGLMGQLAKLAEIRTGSKKPYAMHVAEIPLKKFLVRSFGEAKMIRKAYVYMDPKTSDECDDFRLVIDRDSFKGIEKEVKDEIRISSNTTLLKVMSYELFLQALRFGESPIKGFIDLTNDRLKIAFENKTKEGRSIVEAFEETPVAQAGSGLGIYILRTFIDLYFGEINAGMLDENVFRAEVCLPRDINSMIREYQKVS